MSVFLKLILLVNFYLFALDIKAFSGDRVYTLFINLDRSPDRLKYLLPKVKELELPYFRVSGVEGIKLSETDIAEAVDSHRYKDNRGAWFSKGEIGCYLSHMKAWYTFLMLNDSGKFSNIAIKDLLSIGGILKNTTLDDGNSGDSFALILEDDVEFDPKILKDIIVKLIKNKAKWDIAYLQLDHGGTPITLKELDKAHAMVSYLTNVSEAGGYLINLKAARRLLADAIPIVMPLDYYYIRNWDFKLKGIGVEPRVIRQRKEISSMINDTKKDLKRDRSPGSVFRKKIFNLSSSIYMLCYNLKTHIISKFFL